VQSPTLVLDPRWALLSALCGYGRDEINYKTLVASKLVVRHPRLLAIPPAPDHASTEKGHMPGTPRRHPEVFGPYAKRNNFLIKNKDKPSTRQRLREAGGLGGPGLVLAGTVVSRSRLLAGALDAWRNRAVVALSEQPLASCLAFSSRRAGQGNKRARRPFLRQRLLTRPLHHRSASSSWATAGQTP